uniref:CG8661 n=1 Tax=Haemonchus contortus TaxID=6289 RepID=A0A7I4Z2G1_HAECO|nr:Protein K09C6.9 [Haemonchus contortus]
MNFNLIPVVAATLLGIHLSEAQTPKAKFDSKVIALGVKFYKVEEIAKLTDCIDDSFYNIASMQEIKEKAISCALGNTVATKYITLMNMCSSMDNCLKPEKQTTMKLLDKVTPAGFVVLQEVYNKVIADIKAAKSAGKAKAAVMDIGYTSIAQQVTKPLMEKLCNTLVPIITKLEWNCFLSNIKSLIDFTLYECSKIVKP